jgi:hypothetical protein
MFRYQHSYFLLVSIGIPVTEHVATYADAILTESSIPDHVRCKSASRVWITL